MLLICSVFVCEVACLLACLRVCVSVCLFVRVHGLMWCCYAFGLCGFVLCCEVVLVCMLAHLVCVVV